MALDLDAQGFGFEAASPAFGANLFARLSDRAQTLTASAGSQLAVEGEEARVKALKADAAGRADPFLAESLFRAAFLQNHQVPCTLVERCTHQLVHVFRGEPSDDKINGVFMVAAESHVLFKLDQAAVNAGLVEAFSKSTGQHLLVEALAAHHLGRQNQRLSSSIAVPDLSDDAFRILGAQLPAASGAVLGAQFAVEKPEKMVDLRQSGHGGAGAGMADALLDGDGRREPGHGVHVRPFKDSHVLPHIRGQALQIAALAFGKEDVEEEGGFP